ncbi:DNA adenine methylase [Conexibacter sp. SYSU D00693]|uniref:DNA adenine methylase n=1 Tax=Conexibacter sp. SYSU D00693 TaxID=2812560 RepID=UPI00196B157C|nr:DNA adenine methylase [Conexibacter sp. SYSU D00693]
MSAAGTRIRYMGNKQALATKVAGLCAPYARTRPLVDLFGGMCSVAGAVAPSGRSAYVNDVQAFATLVARCVVASPNGPPSRDRAEAVLAEPYRRNLLALRERFARELATEKHVHRKARPDIYGAAARSWAHAGNDLAVAAEVAGLRLSPAFPYRLATLTFAWGYFGLQQAIEIDSLRYAIDHVRDQSVTDTDEDAWLKVALLQAASRSASAPGHFAQFLRGETDSGLARVLSSRRRSPWDTFLDDLASLRPYGTREWRLNNAVFEGDALDLGRTLDRHGLRDPPVFYADPPYSKEHYSRYYHVLETLTRYDYPESNGMGRYRPDRFRTRFSIKSKVLDALVELCQMTASRDGVLLLSYPSSGLLTGGLGMDLAEVLRGHFKKVTLAIDAPASHSTLGARHGKARQAVSEYVWVAE